MVAYNPLTSGQVTLTIALSFVLLVVGTVLYIRLGWKLEWLIDVILVTTGR